MSRFTLVGVDGNAFCIMGYTAKCLRKAGLGDEVSKMHEEATAGDYYNLIAVCDRYVEMANDALGLVDDDMEE